MKESYAKEIPNLSKGLEKEILPSLTNINIMINDLKSSQSDGVIFNEKYFFDLEDLYASQRIHDLKEIRQSVKVEKAWFEKLSKQTIKCPQNLTIEMEEQLKEFQEILFDGFDHKNARSDNKKLMTRCLGYLVGTKWLDISLIRHFLQMRSQDENQSLPCIVFKELEDKHDAGTLVDIIEEWSDKGVSKICVVVNVGIRNKKTYFATPVLFGNHWACFQINIEKKEILYCDSLVWSPPENFLNDIKFFTNIIDSTFDSPQGKNYTVVFAHKTLYPPTKVHRCDDECLKLPYQGPNMTICGVAALFSAILLSEKGLDQAALPESLEWLRKIHQYNDFSRCLLIKWYVERKITATDIWLSEKVHNFYHTYLSSPVHWMYFLFISDTSRLLVW